MILGRKAIRYFTKLHKTFARLRVQVSAFVSSHQLLGQLEVCRLTNVQQLLTGFRVHVLCVRLERLRLNWVFQHFLRTANVKKSHDQVLICTLQSTKQRNLEVIDLPENRLFHVQTRTPNCKPDGGNLVT